MKTAAVVPVNQHVVGQFAELRKSGRLAHAYLFTGGRGGGTFATAMAVAKVLNCEAEMHAVCGCPSCRKIDAGNYPDLFIIEKPEDKTEILIGQITPKESQPYRPLLSWLSVKALEARVRVVIIKDADLMNAPAANAFLKTLEEPAAGTLFILTTSTLGDILPTVRSRCQHIPFAVSSYAELAGSLKNEYDGEFSVKAKAASVFIDHFILARLDDKELKSFAEDKEEVRLLVETVLTFYRDVLLAKMGAGSGVMVYKDRCAEIERLALKYSREDIIAILDQASRVMKGIKEGFNVKIALTLLKEMI